MIVTIADLGKTALYPEIITKITRGDADAANLQILAAESFVRSYMSKYDLDAIFGTATTAPTFTGADVELIKQLIKTIAVYYLARLSSPNINIELARADFEDAHTWLKDLQKGEVNPSLPYKQDDANTPMDEGNVGVSWDSNIKRTNFF